MYLGVVETANRLEALARRMERGGDDHHGGLIRRARQLLLESGLAGDEADDVLDLLRAERSPVEPSRRERALSLHAEGLSLREIARELGVSAMTVQRDIRAA